MLTFIRGFKCHLWSLGLRDIFRVDLTPGLVEHNPFPTSFFKGFRELYCSSGTGWRGICRLQRRTFCVYRISLRAIAAAQKPGKRTKLLPETHGGEMLVVKVLALQAWGPEDGARHGSALRRQRQIIYVF